MGGDRAGLGVLNGIVFSADLHARHVGPRSFVLFGLPGILLPAYILFALVQRESLEFFGLICPRCGGGRPRPQSFLYRKMACRACGHEWERA